MTDFMARVMSNIDGEKDATIALLAKALEDIKQATVDGRVCNDVAWFSQIETAMSLFETELLRSGFFRCLQDWNKCRSTGKPCGPDDKCGCADEMQAYLDEAREHIVGSSTHTSTECNPTGNIEGGA